MRKFIVLIGLIAIVVYGWPKFVKSEWFPLVLGDWALHEKIAENHKK